MGLKHFNPITPSLRQLIQVDKSSLWKGKPYKALTKGLTKTGGRNNFGRTTIWHRGGGHKQLYRIIDFKRLNHDLVGTIDRIEYDPNRNAFIALVKYNESNFCYILAPHKIAVGDNVISGEKVDIKVGNAMPLKNIPIGTTIHNIELKPGKGGQMIRSAGCSAVLTAKDEGYAQIKLRSGEIRKVLLNCWATIGTVSNPDQKNINIGKAGRNRWLGKRPHVRGVAMNPVDHPHGGGEGKTSGGRHPVTPWGKKTKGKKTRNNKNTNKFIIQKR